MNTSQNTGTTLRIAIIGCGTTALCLARGLQRQPHLRVRIFEAAPEARDTGAAYGIGGNAQKALELLDPALLDALYHAGAVKARPHLRLMKGGDGSRKGTKIMDVDPPVPQMTVSRASFMAQLMSLVQSNTVVFGKRLVPVEKSGQDGPITLRFEDGSGEVVDALIGCDGISSVVRKVVLGSDHPAAEVVVGSGNVHRRLVPIAEAKRAFGDEYCNTITQTGWIGPGAFFLTDFVDNGAAMQVVAGWSNGRPWTSDKPFVEWDKELTRKDCEGWGDLGDGMVKIFCDQDGPLYAAVGRGHKETPTYCRGNVCLAGDAAQAFPPFQGAGAGQAIEDALMLCTLLSRVYEVRFIPDVFRTFDEMRRPRRSRIAASSLQSAALMTGKADVGVDVEGLRRKFAEMEWGEYIWSYDVEAAQTTAVERLQELSNQ